MYRPDIVLMDIRMPSMDGLAAPRQILRSHPSAKTVIVPYYDAVLSDAAREAGACGYALKRNLLDLVPLILSTAPGKSTPINTGIL